MDPSQELKALIADRKASITAKAELGKLGITLKETRNIAPWQLERSEALERRADLRRASNALSTHARAKDENLTDDLVTALEFVNAEITLISNALDLQDSADARIQGRTGESELRDQSGQRIGTMLSNADLRDQSKIAAKLRAYDRSDEPIGIGDFFRGVAGMRTSDRVKNALSEGTDSSGGYAVPTILMPGILNALVPASALLQAGANVAVLDQQADSFKVAATDTIPTAAWRSEHGNVAESEPTFRSITITPRSLAFRFKVSRELLQDAPGLDVALRTAIAQAFAKELDRAGLRGSGVAPEIRGLLNMTGVNAVDMALPDGAALTNYAKLINAARLIKEDNAPPPNAAIMTTREDETIALFEDTTGQPLRRPDALANWKFIASSQLPTNLTVGASTDCSEMFVGDFSLFSFFIREGFSVQLLKELYAETGEVGFICHSRVDVAAMYAKAFAVITGITA